MKISLIPQDSSLTPLSLEGTLTFPHGERRMSRNKLVTGGVKIIDRGQTFKDRVASMVLTLTSTEDEQTIADWYNNRSLLMFSDSLGVYSCKIYSLNILLGVATLEMWITELIVSSEDYIYPPPYVPPVPPTYATMSDGGYTSFQYLGSDSKYYGWGYNSSYNIDPSSAVEFFKQTSVILNGPYVKVSAKNGGFTLLLDSDGNVYGFGYNTYNRCYPFSATTPWVDSTAIIATGCIDISAGTQHCLALKSNGDVIGWGRNQYKQANPDSSASTWTDPTNVIVSDCIAIAAGEEHSLALKTNGDVVGWGSNWSGETNPDSIPSSPPYIWDDPTNVIVSGIASIYAGLNSSGYVSTAGIYSGSGYNQYHRLIDPAGGSGNITDPTATILSNISKICYGDRHAGALDTSGNLYLWGSNEYYCVNPALTIDILVTDVSSPVIEDDVLDFSCGTYKTAFMSDTYGYHAFGYNFYVINPLDDTLQLTSFAKILDLE